MWQTISVRETCERLKTNSVNGLTKDEVEERIKKYGENKLTEKKKESILVKFIKQFNDFMIIILIIASIVSAAISTIPSEKVVPGDLIIIETGSYIPADARIVKSYNLKVEESALTGETIAVLKDERAILSEKAPIGDMINMVFGATIAVARTCRSNSNTEQE